MLKMLLVLWLNILENVKNSYSCVNNIDNVNWLQIPCTCNIVIYVNYRFLNCTFEIYTSRIVKLFTVIMFLQNFQSSNLISISISK